MPGSLCSHVSRALLMPDDSIKGIGYTVAASLRNVFMIPWSCSAHFTGLLWEYRVAVGMMIATS